MTEGVLRLLALGVHCSQLTDSKRLAYGTVTDQQSVADSLMNCHDHVVAVLGRVLRMALLEPETTTWSCIAVYKLANLLDGGLLCVDTSPPQALLPMVWMILRREQIQIHGKKCWVHSQASTRPAQ